MFFIRNLKFLFCSFTINYLEAGIGTGIEEDLGVKKNIPELDLNIDDILGKFENPEFKKQINEEYSELTNKFEQNKSSIQIDRQEFLDDVKALETIKNNFSELGIKGYKEFVSTLFSQTEGGKEYLYKLFLDNPEITKKIIQKNGFPINDSTLGLFLLNFKKEKLNGEKEKLNGEKEKLNIFNKEENKIKKLKRNFLNQIDKLSKYDNPALDGYLSIIKNASENDDFGEAFKEELIRYLKENFVEISDYLRNQKGGEKYYKQFLNLAKKMGSGDAELLAIVGNYERENFGGVGSVDSISVEGLLPEGDIESEGDVVFGVEDDGTKVSLDMSNIPPKREISIEGSDYKMESEIKIGDENYEALVEFEKVNQELTRNIKTLDGIIKYIEKIPEDADISKIIEGFKNIIPYTIRNKLGVNFDNIDSVGDLKQGLIVLIEKKKKYEDELNDAEEKYEKKLEDNMENYRKMVKEQDEKQKETLKFLHSIGFDLIDQTITDRLIEMINNSETLKAKFGFDEKIDLANGELGINMDSSFEDNSLPEERIFAQFVNKIISGDEKHPIEIDSMSHGIPVFRNELGEEILDKKAYVNRELNFGFNSVIENLNITEEDLNKNKENTK